MRGRSNCATVRVAVREVQAADRENRKRFRAAFEEVPALRRKSGADVDGSRDSVQGRRLVCDRLRGEEERGKRQRARGKIGFKRVQRHRGESVRGERVGREGKQRQEAGEEEGLRVTASVI